MDSVSYVQCTLKHITWTAREADASKGIPARKAGGSFAYTTTSPREITGVDGAVHTGNLSIRVNGKKMGTSGIEITHWLNDFDQADYDVYASMNQLNGYMQLTGSLDKIQDVRVISVDEFNKLDNPVMAHTLLPQPSPQPQPQAI